MARFSAAFCSKQRSLHVQCHFSNLITSSMLLQLIGLENWNPKVMCSRRCCKTLISTAFCQVANHTPSLQLTVQHSYFCFCLSNASSMVSSNITIHSPSKCNSLSGLIIVTPMHCGTWSCLPWSVSNFQSHGIPMVIPNPCITPLSH